MSHTGSLEDIGFSGSSVSISTMSSNLILPISKLVGIALCLAPLKVTTWLLWLQVSCPDTTSRGDERPSLDYVALRARRHFQKPLAQN